VAHDLDGGSTTLSRVLEGPVRHRDDLRSFIARFARSREAERISDEDFDPILYTYGLRLFGNLPLIEPLEQSRKRHLGSFAFVLDTSASVDGEAVRAFVDVTYDAKCTLNGKAIDYEAATLRIYFLKTNAGYIISNFETL
jgi:hypothetical protein